MVEIVEPNIVDESNFTPHNCKDVFDDKSWDFLKQFGYVFVESPAYSNAYESIKTEISNGNFDNIVPAMSLFEGFKSAKQFSTHESPLERDSWYLSPRYHGPFNADKVNAVFEAARPIWKSVLARMEKETPGFHYNPNETIGFHRYYETEGNIGLAAHKDSGIVTILSTNDVVEGYMDNEWKQLSIPSNHVMVFLGSICGLMSKNIQPLLHRVPSVGPGKISLGLFLDPSPTDPLFVDGKKSGKTIMNYHEAYFSLSRDAYPNFLKSVGREPEYSY